MAGKYWLAKCWLMVAADGIADAMQILHSLSLIVVLDS